jgi:signal transduction histidine kinase
MHPYKITEPLAVSIGWDGGKPEVERNFENGFPGLMLAIKYRGSGVEVLASRFLRNNLMILGALSIVLAAGIFLTYRSITQKMEVAELKSNFIANVSHEIRTPLALIRLYAETLELGRLTTAEKFQEYYQIIRKESDRLTVLINNILDFSRIEAGHREYDFHETNLAELVRMTTESYRYQIEQQGFVFEQGIADDIPPIRVDPEALARSLLNLINNALKYSLEKKFIRVQLYRDKDMVRLEVIDHGIGIPHKEQAKIFEKFYRVGDPLVHDTKGSGLGLSLVQHIVQAHGGHVRVESTPGKGSKFTISLPVDGGTLHSANA